MPRGTGAPLRPRMEPLTDDHVMASVNSGADENGHYRELIYGGIENAERALEIKRSLFRCAKYLGFSMTAEIEKAGEGFQIRFHAIDKAVARAFHAARYKGREHEMPYNPYHRTKPVEEQA